MGVMVISFREETGPGASRVRGCKSDPRLQPETDRGFNFEYHPRPHGGIFRGKTILIGVGSPSGRVQIAIPSMKEGNAIGNWRLGKGNAKFDPTLPHSHP